jgi:hypothetical protein
MRRTVLSLFSVAPLASLVACAAKPAEAPRAQILHETADDVAAERIAGEVLLRADPKRIVHELADVIGPRLTGTPACDRAEAWVASELTNAGLAVHRETYPIAKWKPGTFEVSLVQPYSATIAATPMGWSGSTPPEGVDGPLKLVPVDAVDKADVKGAIVVIQRPKDVEVARWFIARDHAIRVLHERGALALLLATTHPKAMAAGMCPPSTEDACGLEPLPVGYLGAAEGEKVVSLAGIGKARVVARHESAPGGTASNVVAEIPGSSLAGEIVVVGAHLDSVHTSPGAIDDGAGVASLMEAARVLRALDVRPQRTVRFVFFTGEELGMVGSRAYVKGHAIEMPATTAMVQIDSADTPWTGFFAYGRDDLRPRLEAALAPVASLGANHVYPPTDPLMRLAYSDQAPFYLAGVPALFAADSDLPKGFRTAGEWQVHTPEDSIDKLVPAVASLDSAILAVLVSRLASGPRLGPTLSAAEVKALVNKNHFGPDARTMGRADLAD